ncbi:hypothetical protein Desca_0965 [Desulfotomaculum nigrificans CO-1-SRB]|uniref:DUF4363 family protein n=1 Tax=Desulfotomaculum nigrificans (strain DSM 14880 / VKM B-2319 / CO-1-SRB) TaxID=868595 RepID=F6B2L2_DESCC|nr:DUF4363 family protein [Desulfotomaculum nigrificans]AEF93841.1 hypothetical protein Desca_0965 [Desulfotomaculum nigrificans CO-1-SRB]
MRLLAGLLVVVAAVVSLGLWVNHSLDSAAKMMDQNIKQITEEINRSNWDEAYNQTVALEKTWNQKEKWWPIVLEHQEMDNIKFSMAKAKEYVKSRDKVLSLGQLSELKLMIMHLPEKEAVNLKNIL